jgi:molecular chaperone GrpE
MPFFRRSQRGNDDVNEHDRPHRPDQKNADTTDTPDSEAETVGNVPPRDDDDEPAVKLFDSGVNAAEYGFDENEDPVAAFEAAAAAAEQDSVATEEVGSPDEAGPAAEAGGAQVVDIHPADDAEDAGGVEAEEDSAESATDALARDLEDMRNNWLRALADFDNLRKRTSRDIESARGRDRANILRGFLDVLDNLDRALAATGGEENKWLQGIEAIRRQMLDVFRNFGAQPFESKGQPFDAQRHEAVATANLPDQPEGTVLDVIQQGYAMGDTILRPAKVVVVRHG